MAWREVTELSEFKQGIAIALTLPEDDESQIREKVFDQIQINDLKSINGFSVLIEFLDLHLAKDDLTDSLEKFEDFEDYSRSEGQSINEFVAIFDAKYHKIKNKNMALPADILAFKLLRKANISKEEKLLVLTGMNYDNRETLYEEAKMSLKKFKGNDIESSSNQACIKLESAFMAANEEALLSTGYSKTKSGNQGNYSSESRGSWKRRKLGKFIVRENLKEEFAMKNRKKGITKTINHKGPDGRPLTCNSCGSYRHLLPACPDSWENMKRVNAGYSKLRGIYDSYSSGRGEN